MKKRSIILISLILVVLTVLIYAENKNDVEVNLMEQLSENAQFNDMELYKVLNYLTKTTGTNFTSSTSTMNLKVTLNFVKGDSIEQVLGYLTATYNLDYVICSDHIGDSIIVLIEKGTYNEVASKVEVDAIMMEEAPLEAVHFSREMEIGNSFAFSINSNNNNFTTEEYTRIYENRFFDVLDNPLSTFSIDVDTASYTNVRRFLNQEQLPPEDAVRIEEMINYFNYDYQEPDGDKPFSITTEVAECPWNNKNKLVLVGLQGKEIEIEKIPPNNLVFLIDVSGSMYDSNKLPLLKNALKLMVNQLREEDRISIVAYAGNSTVVLDSTSAEEKQKIIDAIESLGAGGATAGSAGIRTAYQIAKQNFIPEGSNRVILATDGDFNVGVSSTGELVRMIEEKRKQDISLTTLGFGTGNYKDSRMEELSNKGNGNYAYIDNLLEAKKVLVNELGGTLFTIAKDVKIQLEFNPAEIKEYRLIGYENRVMEDQDFADDTKDAGELGAGHTVTALYELVPADHEHLDISKDLIYQETVIKDDAYNNNQLMNIKLRYKEAEESESKLISTTVIDNNLNISEVSSNLKFASAVAQFGMMLRNSEYKGQTTYQNIIELAKESRGIDEYGYRAEFIKLVEIAELIEQTNN
ncbi:MAG: vWA domain-containing protein [Halanaerobiales bacterium]